jgi:hypothetical protein
LKRLQAHLKKKKLPLLKISGATGDGLDTLLEAMWKAIASAPAASKAPAPPASPVRGPDSSDQGDSVDLLTPARTRRRDV